MGAYTEREQLDMIRRTIGNVYQTHTAAMLLGTLDNLLVAPNTLYGLIHFCPCLCEPADDDEDAVTCDRCKALSEATRWLRIPEVDLSKGTGRP